MVWYIHRHVPAPTRYHSGFSVDTSVCFAAQDRAGLERLLRYCARRLLVRGCAKGAASGETNATQTEVQRTGHRQMSCTSRRSNS
ncbi:MAG: hypothetical protein RL297_1922 [Pseudomonadota bacterium]|jgi:hypothetical protein